FRGAVGRLASARNRGPHRAEIGESRIGPFAPRPQSHHDYAACEFDGATRAATQDFLVRARRCPGTRPGFIADTMARIAHCGFLWPAASRIRSAISFG